MFAALLVAVGLFCRISSAVVWLLYLCTAKSAELFSYGVDNFTIIGLFYLAIAPLPDSMAIDARWRGILREAPRCKVYTEGFCNFTCASFISLAEFHKCAGPGWWNGISLWRALTRAPFDIVPPEILIRASIILPVAGILVCVMEATYAIFIWPRKTRFLWFVGVLGMHVRDRLMMGNVPVCQRHDCS